MKVEYEKLLSNLAYNFSLRRYIKANKSYGDATLKESMETIGISHEDLKKYRERFTDMNDESKFLIGWRPRFKGPLDTLAPEAQVLLARSAAEPITPGSGSAQFGC